jgi:hypothetical protein
MDQPAWLWSEPTGGYKNHVDFRTQNLFFIIKTRQWTSCWTTKVTQKSWHRTLPLGKTHDVGVSLVSASGECAQREINWTLPTCSM